MMTTLARRELATREAPWAQRLAATLARSGVRPNTVSVGGAIAALLAMAAFVIVPHVNFGSRALCFVAAGAAIQLRLLCNLLDGMLAVEQGLKSKTGDLFNEVPDRIADAVILVGAGYSLSTSAGHALGWAAATAALFTAYVRVLGGSLHVSQPFIGPMAKQHRMFVLTVGTMTAAIGSAVGVDARSIAVALVLIAAGAAVTAVRRIARIARELEAR